MKPKYQKIVSRLYTDVIPSDTCYYCDAPASTVDHIPALRVADALGFTYLQSIGAPFIKVMCCSDCNSSLSSSMLLTELQRREYLAERLSKKLAKLQATWTTDELAELGHALQTMVLQRQFEADMLMRRLACIRKRKN